MNILRSALIAVALSIAAFPVAAGAFQVTGIALVGAFAGCSPGTSDTGARLPDRNSPAAQAAAAEALRADSAAEPASDARLRDYLEFHAQAQEGTGARAALMPWPALRTHAN